MPVLPAVGPWSGVSAVSPSMSAMRSTGMSSSSATICRMAMRNPVPRSTLPLYTVTLPSGCTARKPSTWPASTVLPRSLLRVAAIWARVSRAASRAKLTTRAPPAFKRPRRVRSGIIVIAPSSHPAGAEHGAQDARVRAAAAEIAGERLLHLGCRRARRLRQQRLRGHHHAVGAVAALGRLLGDESSLQTIGLIGTAEAFEGGDGLALRGACRQQAGAHRFAVHQHRAGAAMAEAAAELRAMQPERVPQQIEHGLIGVPALDVPRLAIDPKRVGRHRPLPENARPKSV